jgi:hypothetical protein
MIQSALMLQASLSQCRDSSKPGGVGLGSEETKGVARIIGQCGIVVGLTLTLPSCTNMKDFLCRPQGHCVDAPDSMGNNNR